MPPAARRCSSGGTSQPSTYASSTARRSGLPGKYSLCTPSQSPIEMVSPGHRVPVGARLTGGDCPGQFPPHTDRPYLLWWKRRLSRASTIDGGSRNNRGTGGRHVLFVVGPQPLGLLSLGPVTAAQGVHGQGAELVEGEDTVRELGGDLIRSSLASFWGSLLSFQVLVRWKVTWCFARISRSRSRLSSTRRPGFVTR